MTFNMSSVWCRDISLADVELFHPGFLSVSGDFFCRECVPRRVIRHSWLVKFKVTPRIGARVQVSAGNCRPRRGSWVQGGEKMAVWFWLLLLWNRGFTFLAG